MKLKNRTLFTLILLLLFFLTQFVSAQDKIKIALWGDSRENKDNACENIAHILLNDVTDWTFQIHTGDFTHDGSDGSWKRTFNYKGIKELFVKDKFFMCTSNHEFKSSEGKSNFDKYTSGILPVNSADSTSHFYAYHISNVHVIFCDAYATSKEIMQNWLDNYLNTVKENEWIIAVWHNPTYDDISYKEGYEATCMPWVESLYKHHCNFIFNGHAHIYLRTNPLQPDGAVDEKSGIVHIINGTGGASWQDPAPASPKTAFSPSERSFPTITFLTIEGNKAHLETVDCRPGNNLKTIDQCDYVK